VARRKHNLDSKPEREYKKLGYEAQITGAASHETPEVPQTGTAYQRKTYLLRPRMIERIAELSEREGLQVNELVRFLLAYGLEEVEAGRLDLPGKVVTVKKRIME
jgi:hypothetical protein